MSRKSSSSCWLALLMIVVAQPALARITPAEYRDIGVAVPQNAALPLDAIVIDEGGHRRPLRALVTRPTVLVFADYTCRTLCGPILAFVSSALEQSGLVAGRQFELLAIGLDPRDGADAAEKMRGSHVDPALKATTRFVTADDATIKTLTAALGYRYAYDAGDDQYLHPAAAYVLRADGAVSRVLTGIGLSGADMRLALVEAGEGKIGTLRDQIRLLCSGFDPAHGTYNVMVSRMLTVTGLVTMFALGGGIGTLMLMGRRRSA
ncbi:MAG TPA: SCO family protein [Pseudolabrys sp.]|nr:SCO family protein [Pseudolabrys sp.]